MPTRQRHPLRNLFASFLLLGSAACAAAPHGAPGPRLETDVPLIERLDLRRTDGGWRVAGTGRCEWPATPARTSLVLRALDEGGRELATIPVTPSLRPQTRRHRRDQRFTFSADVVAPADTACLTLARR